MMKDLYDYYLTDLTYSYLVLKKIQWWKKVLLIVCFFILAVLFSGLVYFLVRENWAIVMGMYIICAVGLYGWTKLAGKWQNRSVKCNLPEVYDFEKKKYSPQKFQELIFNRLDTYLKEEKWDNDKSLDEWLSYIDEQLKDKRYCLIGFYSAMGILFLPMWNQFAEYYFKNYLDVKGLWGFCVIIMIIVMISTFVCMIRNILLEENFFSYGRWKKLKKLLLRYKLWKKESFYYRQPLKNSIT